MIDEFDLAAGDYKVRWLVRLTESKLSNTRGVEGGACHHFLGFLLPFSGLSDLLEARLGILMKNYTILTKNRRDRGYLDRFRAGGGPGGPPGVA